MQKEPALIPYQTLLRWLLLASIIAFFTYLAHDLQVLPRILNVDSTRLSLVILIIFSGASLHCAYRSWIISRQFLFVIELQKDTDFQPKTRPQEISLAWNYLSSLKHINSDQESPQLAEVLAESIRGSHKVGWFIAATLIKLGLLGTVIGFVLMLSSVSGLESLDISDVKQLMQKMTLGMGIAMNTTMVGLVCSMLLGLQYLLLDRSADKFVLVTLKLGEQWRCQQMNPRPVTRN